MLVKYATDVYFTYNEDVSESASLIVIASLFYAFNRYLNILD